MKRGQQNPRLFRVGNGVLLICNPVSGGWEWTTEEGGKVIQWRYADSCLSRYVRKPGHLGVFAGHLKLWTLELAVGFSVGWSTSVVAAQMLMSERGIDPSPLDN